MKKSSKDKILLLLKSRGPQTAGDLAAELGMSAAGAQQHLTFLAEKRLVSSEDRAMGRGRPHRYWHLTAKAHKFFPDGHSGLMVEILDGVEEVFGTEGLEKLIRKRERASLDSYLEGLEGFEVLSERGAKLAEMRSREGYMAEWKAEKDGSFLLIENHCPICAAAEACRGFCRSELAIFRAVLGEGVDVTREEYILEGARRCIYRIRPAL